MNVLGEKIIPFKLTADFIEQFKGKQPEMGPLGAIVFARTYSRELPDGSTEQFWQMAQRVVEGAFTILKWHYDRVGVPWDEARWMPEAEQMFTRIWELKFLPAGRGMWLMGTDFMYEHGSAGLCSCAFVSTKNIDTELAEPFCWAMEASTLGIGCGFDVDGSKKNLIIKKPDSYGHVIHIVADSREGWVDSLRVLLNAYLTGSHLPRYDYSQIRPKGTLLKSFGGRASGPGPLITMHEDLITMLDASIGMPLDSEHIADIFNMIGRCIVSGNIRRSAQIALGDPDDDKFMRLKEDKEKSIAYRWASNNTIKAPLKDVNNKALYEKVVDLNIAGTDVGLVFMDLIRTRGRLIDGFNDSDAYADGVNPCQPADALIWDEDHYLRIDDQSAKTWTSWRTGTKEVLKLTLNTGEIFKCTPEHKVVIRTEDGYADCCAKDAIDKFVINPFEWLKMQDTDRINNYPDIEARQIVKIESLGIMEVWDYRMNEAPHYNLCQGVILANCGEQALESYEVCNLVETYPYRHINLEDYKDTLKYAYLYGKIVTLLPTHWKRTNAVMARNRRIGISQSGIVEAMNSIFKIDLAGQLGEAYQHLRKLDADFSHEFIVNKSNRLTTVKPSGTNSLLAGCSPGIHYPHSEYYIRRVRLSDNSHLIPPLVKAGIGLEPDVYSPNTMVASFPIKSVNFSKGKDDVSVDEQFSHVRTYQTYWSDNQVSVTITFKPEDRGALVEALSSYEGRFKSVSFLVDGDVYAQAPLQSISEDEYLELSKDLQPLDLSDVRVQGTGVMYCTNDKCELK